MDGQHVNKLPEVRLRSSRRVSANPNIEEPEPEPACEVSITQHSAFKDEKHPDIHSKILGNFCPHNFFITHFLTEIMKLSWFL